MLHTGFPRENESEIAWPVAYREASLDQDMACDATPRAFALNPGECHDAMPVGIGRQDELDLHTLQQC